MVKLLRGISVALIGCGVLLFLVVGVGFFEGPVALMVGSLGGCLFTAVGGVLLGRSFFS